MKDLHEGDNPVRRFIAATRPDTSFTPLGAADEENGAANILSRRLKPDPHGSAAVICSFLSLLQSAVIIWFGYHLHTKIEETLDVNSELLLAGAREYRNGVTLVALALFDLCSYIAVSFSWCVAILWWLGQQKKLLKS